MEGNCKKYAYPKNYCHIDRLPDSVIEHILSFLPTKEAVRTCVLSTKWTEFWTNLQSLDFDDINLSNNYVPICFFCKENCNSQCYEFSEPEFTVCSNCYLYDPKFLRMYANMDSGNRRLMNIDVDSKRKVVSDRKESEYVSGVDRAIIVTKKLQKFSMVINNIREAKFHNTWISGLGNKDIKNISITSLFYDLPLSPLTLSHIYNADSLTDLTLNLHLFSPMKIPKSMKLKNLRFLKLVGILFSGSRAFYLPVLKEFSMINCVWTDGETLLVKAPEIDKICIQQDANISRFILLHDQLDLSIKCDTLSLKELKYSGVGVLQTIHLLPHQRYSAVITFQRCTWRTFTVDERLPFLFALLQQFTWVEDIQFEGVLLEVLNKAKEVKIPIFSMLRNLKLVSVPIEVVILLMQNSPKLNKLVLKGIQISKEFFSDFEVPDSMSSSLKIVRLEGYSSGDGCEHNLVLAELFLKYGMMLEEMHFLLASKTPNKANVENKFRELVCRYKQDSDYFCYKFND